MTWESVTKDDQAKLEKVAETQREMSEYYSTKYSKELLADYKENRQGLEIHTYEDDQFFLHFILRPDTIRKGYKLQTCAVKYKEKEDPHAAALILLGQLKKLVGDLPVYARWANNNPDLTMAFYNAVADDQNAREAGFRYCETVTEWVAGYESYYTEWA